MTNPVYTIIVPVYNEEEVLPESYRRLRETMDQQPEPYELLFVNDGSRDQTLNQLRQLAQKDSHVRVLSFSRNFGHQNAISAGMDHASGRAIVVIDADLQDPPSVILEMIQKWKDGYDVVYGRRIKRKGETAFKKVTAKLFYRTLNAMTDVDIPVDTGDFRLIDRRVRDALCAMPEKNRYVRGLVSWVGFRQTAVDYVREERFAGTTKYPLKKMLKFAGDALTSFSHKPLQLSIWLGALISSLSFLYLLWIIIVRIFFPLNMVSGWASLAAITLFGNGIVLLMLGVIGQYIARIYDEAKGRPLYIIAERLGFDGSTSEDSDI